VVTVTRIDRLARSTFDLFAIVKQIVDAKAQFRPLAEPWADTGTSTSRLMIAVLGGLADERARPKALASRSPTHNEQISYSTDHHNRQGNRNATAQNIAHNITGKRSRISPLIQRNPAADILLMKKKGYRCQKQANDNPDFYCS
jgi:hypothetical protein